MIAVVSENIFTPLKQAELAILLLRSASDFRFLFRGVAAKVCFPPLVTNFKDFRNGRLVCTAAFCNHSRDCPV